MHQPTGDAQDKQPEQQQATVPVVATQPDAAMPDAMFILPGPDGNPMMVPATPEAKAVYGAMQYMGHRVYHRWQQAELRFWISVACNIVLLGWLWIR